MLPKPKPKLRSNNEDPFAGSSDDSNSRSRNGSNDSSVVGVVDQLGYQNDGHSEDGSSCEQSDDDTFGAWDMDLALPHNDDGHDRHNHVVGRKGAVNEGGDYFDEDVCDLAQYVRGDDEFQPLSPLGAVSSSSARSNGSSSSSSSSSSRRRRSHRMRSMSEPFVFAERSSRRRSIATKNNKNSKSCHMNNKPCSFVGGRDGKKKKKTSIREPSVAEAAARAC